MLAVAAAASGLSAHALNCVAQPAPARGQRQVPIDGEAYRVLTGPDLAGTYTLRDPGGEQARVQFTAPHARRVDVTA